MSGTNEVRTLYKTCPLCGSAEIREHLKADCTRHPLYQKELPPLMTWRTCKENGHLFTDGYFTDEALRIVFRKTNEHQKVGTNVERDRLIWAKIVDRVAEARSSLEGSWLDVGFGNGSLLFTAAEWGYKVCGIDLRQENVDALKSMGYEAHGVELTAFRELNRFDVVSMADVLEHMPFPIPALEHAHRLLHPSGLLFISMPNTDCIVWKALDQQGQNPYWGELEHYHHLSRGQLYRLLEQTGFRPVRYDVSERYRACMEVIAQKA